MKQYEVKIEFTLTGIEAEDDKFAKIEAIRRM